MIRGFVVIQLKVPGRGLMCRLYDHGVKSLV